MGWKSAIPAVGLAAGGAAFWLIYFDLKDSLRPEPRRLLALAFVAGALAALPALGGYRLAAALGMPFPAEGDRAAILAYCLLLVGPLEETVKFIAARLTVFRRREFDECVDGLVYSAAVAIGFATVESLLYATFLSPLEQLARALAAPLVHALFAAVWGFAAARALLKPMGSTARVVLQVAAVAAAALLHGLYDAVLLAWDAPVASSALVLVLWLSLIGATRAVTRRSRMRLPA